MKRAALLDGSMIDEVAGNVLSIKRSATDKRRIGRIPLGFDGKCNSSGYVYDRTGKQGTAQGVLRLAGADGIEPQRAQDEPCGHRPGVLIPGKGIRRVEALHYL